jgi:membrane protein
MVGVPLCRRERALLACFLLQRWKRAHGAYQSGADMKIKPIWNLIKEAFKSWKDDYAPSMGAAIAYYTMFSIAPLLLIVISVAGFFFGAEVVQGQVMAQLEGLMGEQGAQAIEEMLARVNRPEEGLIGTVIGVVVLLIGATTVFAEVQGALDRIWRAPARKQGSGLWSLLRGRLLSFGMILGFAFLLMVSLVLDAALAGLAKWWSPWFGAWEMLAHAVNVAVSFALFTVVFAMIYKFMPRVSIHWRDVWVGSAVTALLFAIGKFLIGLYLGRSEIGNSFGAAGSVVIVMVWVYYSAQIFLLGSEFTWVYAHEFGSRRGQPRPKADAEAAEEAQPQASQPVPQPVPAAPVLGGGLAAASIAAEPLPEDTVRAAALPMDLPHDDVLLPSTGAVVVQPHTRSTSLVALGVAAASLAAAGAAYGFYRVRASVPSTQPRWREVRDAYRAMVRMYVERQHPAHHR